MANAMLLNDDQDSAEIWSNIVEAFDEGSGTRLSPRAVQGR